MVIAQALHCMKTISISLTQHVRVQIEVIFGHVMFKASLNVDTTKNGLIKSLHSGAWLSIFTQIFAEKYLTDKMNTT